MVSISFASPGPLPGLFLSVLTSSPCPFVDELFKGFARDDDPPVEPHARELALLYKFVDTPSAEAQERYKFCRAVCHPYRCHATSPRIRLYMFDMIQFGLVMFGCKRMAVQSAAFTLQSA